MQPRIKAKNENIPKVIFRVFNDKLQLIRKETRAPPKLADAMNKLVTSSILFSIIREAKISVIGKMPAMTKPIMKITDKYIPVPRTKGNRNKRITNMKQLDEIYIQ